jgi:hypothetical protein
MMDSRVPKWVWAVLVLAHTMALAWALRVGSWEFPDSARYLQAANNLLLHGELYARVWPKHLPQGQAVQEFTIRTLGYPVAVMGLSRAAGQPVAILLVQNVLSLLNLGLVLSWWARWTRPNSVKWVWALLAILSFPAQLIYANAVMSETLLQTVVVLFMGAVLAFIGTRENRYFAGIGVATIAALLIKPVFYPLAGIFAGLGLVLALRCKRLALAVMGLVPVVVVVAYMGWNGHRTGYFHFSSITEINLLHYNAAGVVKQVRGSQAEEQWVNEVLKEANAQPSFARRQRFIRERAGAVLWTYPVVYARQQVQGMAAFFVDPGRFDISQFLRMQPLSGGLLAKAQGGGLLIALKNLPFGLMTLLGVVFLANVARLLLAVRGFRRLGQGDVAMRYGRWVAVGLLFYVVLLTGPLGAARFLVPVWPVLLGLALMGMGKVSQFIINE